MLQDKDRIFTNLYGLHDWGLEGARARGAWDGTKAILEKGRDWHHQRDEGLRPARPRRRRLPDRAEMVVHAQAVGRPAALSRRQCRRVRARHLQGPRDHAARSASADRGLPVSPASRWARNAGYIYVRGEFIRERERLQAAIDQAYEAKLIGKNNIHGWDFDLYVHHGAGAYICGEETALLESLEGKKGQPRLKPPFPANIGLYGCPTTVNNVETIAQVPDILRRGARLVRRHRPAEQHRHQAVLHLRPRRAAVQCRRGDGHPAARADREACRRRARRLGQSAGRHSRRLVDAAAAGRAGSGRHAAHGFRRLPRQEVGARHRRRDRDGQVDRHHPRDRAHLLFLQARELRPVHAVPRGHGLDVARAHAHGRRPRPEARDRHADARSRSRSRATPSARSATAPPGRCRA